MLLLPNGCKCSKLSVFPTEWETDSVSTEIDWRIQYYFYDSDGNRKRVIIKGMNHIKEVKQRSALTKGMKENEEANLKRGYNPILNAIIAPPETGDIDTSTPFILALKKAHERLKLSAPSMESIKSAIKYIEIAAGKLGYINIEVSKITRKYIVRILDECNLSPQSYNHYRAYLMQLFTELIILEATETNPVDRYIKKKDVEENIKELFTEDERKAILKFYRNDKYFTRFLQIFFHSGSREIELPRIKTEKVNLEKSYFKIKVLKRKKIVEEKRVIKKIVHHYWVEAVNECKQGDYIFGTGLKPGTVPCTRDWITKKWQADVKKGLGINKNLYWLKHTNLDETAAILDAEAAAKQAGHKSTVITLKHYLLNEEERQRERLREVNNKFA